MNNFEELANKAFPNKQSLFCGAVDVDKLQRTAHIKGQVDLLESLTKKEGWVIRDIHGDIKFSETKPTSSDQNISKKHKRMFKESKGLSIPDLFPDLKYGDEPIKVEVLVRKL